MPARGERQSVIYRFQAERETQSRPTERVLVGALVGAAAGLLAVESTDQGLPVELATGAGAALGVMLAGTRDGRSPFVSAIVGGLVGGVVVGLVAEGAPGLNLISATVGALVPAFTANWGYEWQRQ